MRTEVKTIAEVDRLVFGYWDEEEERFVELEDSTSEEEIAKVAEKFGCTPLLVNTLIFFAMDISSTVGKDLKGIWKKVSG